MKAILFAFAPGQELSEHTAPFDALVFALEGQADVSISGTPHRVQAGEMIIMPAGKPHALKAVDLPVVEVHLSNIHQREDFRQHSYVAKAAKGMICGFGSLGYSLALDAIHRLIT